jgi:hypothetical protein
MTPSPQVAGGPVVSPSLESEVSAVVLGFVATVVVIVVSIVSESPDEVVSPDSSVAGTPSSLQAVATRSAAAQDQWIEGTRVMRAA